MGRRRSVAGCRHPPARATARRSRGARRRGAETLVGGAALTGVQSQGFAPLFGIVTAIALVAFGTLAGNLLPSAFGSLALLVNVPWAIGHYFPEQGQAPLLIMVSGALIIAVAVLLTRTGRPGSALPGRT